jgi:hypothetical protein
MTERSDDTVKVGLLMEAAETHQSLASRALERLREHTAGLDTIVREEVRHTLLEELHAVIEDSQHAREALLQLGRSVKLRFAFVTFLTLVVSAAVQAALFAWWLPSPAEVAALGAQRAELTASLALLTRQGGRVQLRRCGHEQRLCVRIDHDAPAYGQGGDYRVVQGY